MNHGTPQEARPLSCARALVLLEIFLDGELEGGRLARFRAHLQGCTACRAELEAAQRIQATLRDFPAWECPEEVTRRVVARVEAEARMATPSLGRRLAAWGRRWTGIWRPALAGVGVAVTALLIALATRQPTRPSLQGTEEHVRAEQEVRWALAYVAQVTRRSSDQALGEVMEEVVSNVIGETVVAPITQAVRRPLKEDGS